MKRPCINCGAPATHDHHVVPRSLGGVATVPLCHECHGKAHGRAGGFRHTSELTRVALAKKKARGERVGSVPFGYAVDADGRLVPSSAELEIIAKTKHFRSLGMSLRRVVAALSRAGVVGRTGKPLGLVQVQHIVSWQPADAVADAREIVAAERAHVGRDQMPLFGGIL